MLLQRAAFAGRLVKTADEIYVRFHGPQRWYRHNYSSDELAEWARRIKASGASRVWAYFNNDRDCYAISNARELRRQLGGEIALRSVRNSRSPG